MRTNHVKEKLKRGDPALGAWLNLPSISSARMIESAQALQNLDEILSVPGIDVAFVGPNDLHAQLGLAPSSDGAEPEFLEALERIQADASKYHLALGIFSGNGKISAERICQGFQMISITSDLRGMIESATQNLRIARQEH